MAIGMIQSARKKRREPIELLRVVDVQAGGKRDLGRHHRCVSCKLQRSSRSGRPSEKDAIPGSARRPAGYRHPGGGDSHMVGALSRRAPAEPGAAHRCHGRHERERGPCRSVLRTLHRDARTSATGSTRKTGWSARAGSSRKNPSTVRPCFTRYAATIRSRSAPSISTARNGVVTPWNRMLPRPPPGGSGPTASLRHPRRDSGCRARAGVPGSSPDPELNTLVERAAETAVRRVLGERGIEGVGRRLGAPLRWGPDLPRCDSSAGMGAGVASLSQAPSRPTNLEVQMDAMTQRAWWTPKIRAQAEPETGEAFSPRGHCQRLSSGIAGPDPTPRRPGRRGPARPDRVGVEPLLLLRVLGPERAPPTAEAGPA